MADIKDKIAKLLALAESPEPEEAKAVLLRAQALMAKYKLCPEECQKTESKVIKACAGVECTKMTDSWAAELSAIIAKHYCCAAYRVTEMCPHCMNEIEGPAPGQDPG